MAQRTRIRFCITIIGLLGLAIVVARILAPERQEIRGSEIFEEVETRMEVERSRGLVGKNHRDIQILDGRTENAQNVSASVEWESVAVARFKDIMSEIMDARTVEELHSRRVAFLRNEDGMKTEGSREASEFIFQSLGNVTDPSVTILHVVSQHNGKYVYLIIDSEVWKGVVLAATVKAADGQYYLCNGSPFEMMPDLNQIFDQYRDAE